MEDSDKALNVYNVDPDYRWIIVSHPKKKQWRPVSDCHFIHPVVMAIESGSKRKILVISDFS